MRVTGFGQTIFGGVRVKELLALGAAVLRIDQLNIARLTRDQVAHVMQHAGAGPIAKTRLAALRARQLCKVTTAAHALRRRQIFGIRNPRRGVRQILSGT